MSNSDSFAATREPSQEDVLFSIGAITHITGIPEATLRMWERRYSFPHAQRTAGGHRQYSQQETLQLLWVKMRLDDGMRTGRAIRARHLMRKAEAIATALQEKLPGCPPPNEMFVAIQAALLSALLAYDSDEAARILTAATADYSPDKVAIEVIGPTLSAIGDAWRSDETSIATEHFASNFLRHQLLGWIRTSPPPYSVSPIVLACAPEELHEGSLLVLGAMLRQLRWPILYLGQTLPLAELAEMVSRVHPALIVFVAMSEPAALALADWPMWLAQQTQTEQGVALPIIGYGGRAFTENPALADLVPGVLLGTTLCEGCQRIRRLMLHLNVLEL